MSDACHPSACRARWARVWIVAMGLGGWGAGALRGAGGLDTWNPTVTITPAGIMGVYATAVQPDQKIPLGGLFSHVSTTARNNVARLNLSGATPALTVDTSFNPGTGAGSSVYCVAVQPDGKIVIGGLFASVNGAPNTARLARLNSNGTVDGAFTPDPGPNDLVHSIALQPDGKIVIAGLFTSVAGQSRNYIARLDANGSVESTDTFNPGTGADDYVYSVALQPDGKILMAGNFTTVNGQSRVRIARLNSDGTVESTDTFNPGAGANNRVYSILPQPDGKILAAGNFTLIGGQSRTRIARLNSDGSVEGTGSFDPGTGADYYIYSVALQADGKMVIAGGFTEVGGLSRSGVARLNANGGVDAGFDPGLGTDWDAMAVAIQADGKVILGGQFTTFNGVGRSLICRLLNDSVSQSVSVARSQVIWTRGGAAPEVSQVTFELSTDGGGSWSPLGGGSRISGGWQLTGLNLPTTGRVRARGRTAGGFCNGSSGIVEQVQIFTLPTMTTLAATGVTTTGAILNGTVNANGTSTAVSFDYGTTTAYGTNVAGTPTPVTGSSDTPVSAAVSGLAPGTTYHFRVNGVSSSGSASGGDLTFTTPGVPDIAVEQPVGTGLTDGTGTVDLGSVGYGSSGGPVTFTIRNTGTGDLTGLAITTDGANPDDFGVSAIGSTTVVPGDTTTFTVTFTPGAVGSRGAAIHVASNVSGAKNPFDISVSGTGTDGAGPTGGTMLLSPSSPFNPSTSLTVSFSDWSDPSTPLAYAVLVDDVVVSPAGPTASRNFTGPSAPGVHSLKGRVYDSLNNFTEVLQYFTVNTASESWRLQWFGSTANFGDGADTATPDDDGIMNLMKYALLINPGSAGNSQMPPPQIRTYAEGKRLAIVFNRDPARNDITVIVEAADSPGGLSSAPTLLASSVNGAAMNGPGLVSETDISGGRKSVEVRDLVNVAPGTRRFLRIRVVR